MSLRHLFRKKVNMNLCYGIKEHYGKHRCMFLARRFCTWHEKLLKHSHKANNCPCYKEGNE